MAMNKRHRRVLQQNMVRLTEDLEPIGLLGYLFQEGAILEDDMERVRSKSTRKLQAEELLRIIPRRGAKAFDRFCDVLYKIHGQRHLAKMLKEDIENSKGMRNYRITPLLTPSYQYRFDFPSAHPFYLYLATHKNLKSCSKPDHKASTSCVAVLLPSCQQVGQFVTCKAN